MGKRTCLGIFLVALLGLAASLIITPAGPVYASIAATSPAPPCGDKSKRYGLRKRHGHRHRYGIDLAEGSKLLDRFKLGGRQKGGGEPERRRLQTDGWFLSRRLATAH
jgi:hypothetical protein